MIDKIADYTDFWRGIVTPDHDAFQTKTDELRLAFHAAISLFHMSDWVYVGKAAYVRLNFNFKDKNGIQQPAVNEKQFANAVRDLHPNFELIRGIANSAKHLMLTNATKAHHPNAPSNAANTVLQGTGYGQGGYGSGPYGGAPRVMLEGPNGNDLEFSDIAKSVYQMWITLAAKHGWAL